MTRDPRPARALATWSLLCLLATSCRAPRPVEPSVEFSTVPRADAGGPATTEAVAGTVRGAGPNQRVVLFAKSGGVWWVQPFRSRPFTQIEQGSTWKNQIHLGTEYAALLVEAEYRPPATTEALPDVGGGVVAVARAAGMGAFAPAAPKTLTFSGYEWEVRQQPSDRRGLNEYDARNAWVDAEGRLHLLLSERDGRWTSAEVLMRHSLGYGTYSVAVPPTTTLDPAAVFSVFTWDALGSSQNYRELTINVRTRGESAEINGQYVVQPETVPANVYRFALPAVPVDHAFRWQPGQVSFQTVRRGARHRAGQVVAERVFTAGVPAAGAENLHMTLLYDRSAAKPPSGPVEVVVERFAFLP